MTATSPTEYARRNPTYHVEDSAWKARHVLAMIDRHGLRPRTVCDVGCGAGEVLRQLQSALPAGTRFDGYEISPQAHELCLGRANDAVRFHLEDFAARAPRGERFDLLLCLDVVEHVEDYPAFLRALRPRAAHAIFHIPLDMSVQSVWRRRPIVETRRRLGHLHCFMKDTALAALADAGYEIVDRTYTPVEETATRLAARLARLPRKLLALASTDLAARLLGGWSLLVLARPAAP